MQLELAMFHHLQTLRIQAGVLEEVVNNIGSHRNEKQC
jgi:hypothetical protein